MSSAARTHAVALGEVLEEVDTRAGMKWGNLTVLSLTKDRGLIPQTERFKHRVATDDVSKYKVVKPGQLVYNPYVLWEGAIHTLSRKEPGLVSPVYPVWEAHSVDPWYLDFLLRSPHLIAAYEQMASGTVKRRRSISRRDFLSIEIDLPSLTEQQRIVRILSTIQRARQSYDRECESLRSLLVSQRESEFNGTHSIAALGDVALSVKYGTSEQCSHEGPGPVVLGITNVKEVDVDPTGAKKFPVMPPDDHGSYLQNGDLLFVRTNADQRRIGKCAVYSGEPSPAMFASYLLRARVDQSRVNPWYLAHYAASIQGREALQSSGSGAADGKFNLNGPSLKAWSFPLPSLAVQQETVNRLEVTKKTLSAAQHSLNTIDIVIKSALSELIGAWS